MGAPKSKYHYNGPVYMHQKMIADKWEGDTWAPSDAKALSNLSYRYKTTHNLIPGTKIILDPDYLFETTAINDDEIYHQMTLEEVFNGQLYS